MTRKWLPDVNVWFAMTFEFHEHHPIAQAWFDSVVDDRISFCRTTQQGLLRLSTNPKAAKDDVLTMDEAWKRFDEYLADPRIDFCTEPAGIDMQWRTYAHGKRFSTNVWTDAYLAAFAKCSDHEIVTIDGGFKQYTDVPVTFLK